MRVALVVLLNLALGAGVAGAQTGPRVVKLTLHPAAAPIPALKYHLLPWASEREPGNGAVFYQRAHSPEIINSFLRSPDYEQMADWLEKPLNREQEKKLAFFAAGSVTRELDHAARCEYVDWQLTGRVRQENFMMLLYDVQSFRVMIRLLAARMRLETERGEIDKAVVSLQTGLAMSRDVGQSTTLISHLVGAALGTVMLNQAELLVQRPETPSLYWAFTELPEPFLDLRRPLQVERLSVEGLFPEIRQALDDPSRPPVSTERLREMLAKLQRLGVQSPGIGYVALAAIIYPEARTYFLGHGYSAEQLDNMPVTQVTLMYELLLYDRWFDDMYKLQGFPYWQARPALRKINEELRHAHRRPEAGMFMAREFLPAFEKVFFAPARLQRRIALLRVIEALRLHAAAHQGQLPETLEDVRDVPLPVDPVTGRTFNYHRQSESRALLEAPPPPGEQANEGNAIRYEVSLAPRKP